MFQRKKNHGQQYAKGFSLPGNEPINNLQLGALQAYQTSIARQRAVNKFRQ
jgi:hypothetical protein